MPWPGVTMADTWRRPVRTGPCDSGRQTGRRGWDAGTTQALWVVVLLGGGRSATLDAAGNLHRADDGAEQGLVYLIEKTPGKIELFEPTEFRKLVKQPSAGE